jgi:hypothetical protein
MNYKVQPTGYPHKEDPYQQQMYPGAPQGIPVGPGDYNQHNSQMPQNMNRNDPYVNQMR